VNLENPGKASKFENSMDEEGGEYDEMKRYN
jgi:hypothetical protein